MILSASGWRKVFAASGDGQDRTAGIGDENRRLSVIAAEVFGKYMRALTDGRRPVIVCGKDSRPTGPEIADAAVRALTACGAEVRYIGTAAAPEIMAYARDADGFLYISASHNPIGHNGIKFGLHDGGVLDAGRNAALAAEFGRLCAEPDAAEAADRLASGADKSEVARVYENESRYKREALSAYRSFAALTVTAAGNAEQAEAALEKIRAAVRARPLGVVCDMNGSARAASVDAAFFADAGVNFYAINRNAGEIVHEIIPEPENLVWCADEMERLHREGRGEVLIGYTPDCDGDRGNIVCWDDRRGKAVILSAQEVFALSVLAELSYSCWLNGDADGFRPAVAVNGPTSMRIEEIAAAFGAKVFRAEVGEANVTETARKKRGEGFCVRVCGEGSNGGTVTYPAAVRDPLNTVFAVIKLLALRGDGPYRLWCRKSGHEYRDDFSLADILGTLPAYTTTGVSEPRAALRIRTGDHAVLKGKFQRIFEAEYREKRQTLLSKYGIKSYEAVLTNGTEETRHAKDFSKSGKGGLKVIFYSEGGTPEAFIWMRGSGTEPVFRILCDVRGRRPEMEAEFLAWETEMLLKSDQ